MSRFISTATYKLWLPNSTPSTLDITGDYRHISLDGIGSPPVFRHYRPYPNAEGGTDQGFRLQERNMTWRLLISDTSESNLEDARNNLADFLKPHTEAFTLEVTRADSEERYIDVYLNGPVDFAQSRQTGLSYVVTIPLYAPDPLWYDPGPYEPWDPYGGGTTDGFSSYGATSATFTLTYGGNWWEFPTIEITNDFEDLVLDVNPIGVPNTHEIDFTGYTTVNGDTTYVDLRRKLAFRDSSGADVSGEIVNSDWAQTRLYPAPLASSGDHTITATYTSRGGSSAIGFRYRDRYIHL